MDLCADQLLARLPLGIMTEDIAPEFRRVFGCLPLPQRISFNADRLLNRHFLLPQVVRRIALRADIVHIVDHSYAHLVHSVLPRQVGVYCHDLDAFRSVFQSQAECRPWWFRRLAQRILSGMQSASVVFHSTEALRERIVSDGSIDPNKLVYAPYGVSPEFTPQSPTPVVLPVAGGARYVLHVGSSIPRKRLDILLEVFAGVQKVQPELRLIQVGGQWTDTLAERISRLGIGHAITQLRGLTRDQLAELYRRATAVLVTSEAEGFGLPVIEALACGAIVIASDIPTLREAGGDAAMYCKVADVPTWIAAVMRVLSDSSAAPRREDRLSHAARFTWAEHARIIGNTYIRLAKGLSPR